MPFTTNFHPSSLDEWRELRGKLIEKVWANLGTRPDHSLDLEPRETGENKMDGYTVKNIVFQSRKDFLVTGNLYVPEGLGPFPAVLDMHGHWSHEIRNQSEVLSYTQY
ncbi:MAG: hypothetical protein GXP32_00590 [Kiritimatiellaeota bacterium]|nr:hypothetical protein [Kiritimatiellota bacterium]